MSQKSCILKYIYKKVAFSNISIKLTFKEAI